MSSAAYSQLQRDLDDFQEVDDVDDSLDVDLLVEESLFDGISDLADDMAAAEAETEQDDTAVGVHGLYLRHELEKIKKEIEQGGQPHCYKNGTFWLRPRDALFALNTSWSEGVNATELYHLPIFVWLPDMLPDAPNKLTCPGCGHHHLTRHGNSHQ